MVEEKGIYAKLLSDLETTVINYNYMQKRLSLRGTFVNFILIYYSIILIINGLLTYFFQYLISKDKTLDFFGVVGSIVLLAFSIWVTSAKYNERVSSIIVKIKELKELKKKIQKFEKNESEAKLDELSNEYNSLIRNVELRSDSDYWLTCQKISKQNQFIWFESLIIIIKIALEFLCYIIFLVAPIFYFINIIK